MDFSKIKDSKALKVALIIAVPTVLVASYYGYKFVKKKFFTDENSEIERLNAIKKKLNAEKRKNYEDIKSVDDFINAVKYIDINAPYGYPLDKLEDRKEYLESIDFEKLKHIKSILYKEKNDDKETEELLSFLQGLYATK
jgi:hypothetical protein